MFVVFWVVPCGACASDRVSGERSDHNIVVSEALRLQWSHSEGSKLLPDSSERAHDHLRAVLLGGGVEDPMPTRRRDDARAEETLPCRLAILECDRMRRAGGAMPCLPLDPSRP